MEINTDMSTYHWTQDNVKSYKTSFLFHFVTQVENKMEELNITNETLAEMIGISSKKLYKLLDNPIKIKMKMVFKITKALECHVGLVIYDKSHGIKKKHPGPIYPGLMEQSWMLCERPVDNFEMEDCLK